HHSRTPARRPQARIHRLAYRGGRIWRTLLPLLQRGGQPPSGARRSVVGRRSDSWPAASRTSSPQLPGPAVPWRPVICRGRRRLWRGRGVRHARVAYAPHAQAGPLAEVSRHAGAPRIRDAAGRPARFFLPLRSSLARQLPAPRPGNHRAGSAWPAGLVDENTNGAPWGAAANLASPAGIEPAIFP